MSIHINNIYCNHWLKNKRLETITNELTSTLLSMIKNISKEKAINQIQDVIDLIKHSPDSRRMVVTAWNPSVLNEIALPSCHAFFIFSVTNGKLNCHLTQRSGDIALGIPFNLACYATLTQMIAQETNLALGEFSHYINDAHILRKSHSGT